MSIFFVSCPLNFEKELTEELKSFWFEMMDLDGLPTRSEVPEFAFFQGGIEFETQDHLGFQINFFTKIASRVLMRIAKFEARYFDQFEKNLSQIDFAKYFNLNDIELKIESHKSRLNNVKNLTEAASRVLTQKNINIKDEANQKIYIRLEKDRVTISLDTSGEHLHRRGYATHRGEAPLRETLAAYMIRQLNKQVKINNKLTIIDPFAGSGTLLFEACSWNLPNFERDYSWLHYKTSPKLFKSETWKKNYRWINTTNYLKCFAYDIEDKAIRNIQKNIIDYQNTFHQKIDLTAEVKDSSKVEISCSDETSLTWIISNPPYGIRLENNDAQKILEKFDGSADGMLLIHPINWKFKFNKFTLKESMDFNNQGLKLKLSVFIKN